MKRYLPFMLILLLPLAGCKPAGRALASLQYHNLEFKLAESIMTITVGDGSIDLKPLMRKESYTGKTTVGHVTAEYPEGFEAAAHSLAEQFNSFYPVAKEKIGIDWSFDLRLKLVCVPNESKGFRYTVKLGAERVITFPVPVTDKGLNPKWYPVIAHEMTESSMIAPRKRSQILLADLYAGPFCIPLGTRWLRDGISDYASYLFQGSLPPARVYSELNRVRNSILTWANCTSGSPNWYDASTGLVYEIINRYGEDAVPLILQELSEESVPGGNGVERAFKRVTGEDLRSFLAAYQTPWMGVAVKNTGSETGVAVAQVLPATPASRRGIKPGDVIVSLAEQPVASIDVCASILARQKVGQMVPVVIKRNSEYLFMRVKTAPRPQNITEEQISLTCL